MAHLLPRKIKKACKYYLYSDVFKTRWLRHVHAQCQGRVDRYIPYEGDYDPYYITKYGQLIYEYLTGIVEYSRGKSRNKLYRGKKSQYPTKSYAASIARLK